LVLVPGLYVIVEGSAEAIGRRFGRGAREGTR